MDWWLENEFLKKTPSPKFGLESLLGTFDFEFVNLRFGNLIHQWTLKARSSAQKKFEIIDVFIHAISNFDFDKLQSRKSQAGTQVRILDLEFSLATHFPTNQKRGQTPINLEFSLYFLNYVLYSVIN